MIWGVLWESERDFDADGGTCGRGVTALSSVPGTHAPNRCEGQHLPPAPLHQAAGALGPRTLLFLWRPNGQEPGRSPARARPPLWACYYCLHALMWHVGPRGPPQALGGPVRRAGCFSPSSPPQPCLASFSNGLSMVG